MFNTASTEPMSTPISIVVEQASKLIFLSAFIECSGKALREPYRMSACDILDAAH